MYGLPKDVFRFQMELRDKKIDQRGQKGPTYQHKPGGKGHKFEL